MLGFDSRLPVAFHGLTDGSEGTVLRIPLIDDLSDSSAVSFGVFTATGCTGSWKRQSHEVIDFKLEESEGEPRNLMRIRIMRNVGYEPRWHYVKVGDNFQVSID